MLSKTIALTLCLLAGAMLVFTFMATYPWFEQEGIAAFAPMIVPLICVGLSLRLLASPRDTHRARRGLVWGALTAGSGLLVLLAFSLFPHWDLCVQDGTAHWVYVVIPGVWIGLPALGLGAICGWGVGRWIDRTRGPSPDKARR